MNEVLKTIAERYSCRSFDGKMPENDILKAIAEAAVTVPSANNLQPWRVIVVKNKALIDEMDLDAMEHIKSMPDKTMYNKMMERGGKIYYNAPCMMLLPIDTEKSSSAALDCGIVCQTLALAAASLGVDSLICGMMRFPLEGKRGAEFKKAVAFPEGYSYGTAVLLGYSANKTEPHKPDYSKISVVE